MAVSVSGVRVLGGLELVELVLNDDEAFGVSRSFDR